MYTPGPSATEAAMFGLTVDEATPSTEIWPDNIQSVNAFISMATQWRVGFSGATGLDYSVLPTVLRLTSMPRSDWPEIFQSIRVLEETALETMRSKRG